jgi:hypothetical protein
LRSSSGRFGNPALARASASGDKWSQYSWEAAMSTIQHEEAQKLLPIISSAVTTHKLLTYRTAAKELGRNPKTNSRMVAQVCDLLDAAAAFASVPLLALVTVRELSGNINRKAFAGESSRREAIINRSLAHKFSAADFKAISQALKKLEPRGNRAAWKFVHETIPSEELNRRLAESEPLESSDAIDDIGTDTPIHVDFCGVRYARDPKIREAVKRRAGGRCEFCGELGFKCVDGTRYLECHHIIALANDGADRMTNVIGLCAAHHREAHFGHRRMEIEKEMSIKMMIIEGANEVVAR